MDLVDSPTNMSVEVPEDVVVQRISSRRVCEDCGTIYSASDESGSTGKIIHEVEAAPPGTKWAIGTEMHLVNRLKHQHPEQEIHFLSPVVCMCATMYRIDLATHTVVEMESRVEVPVQ